MDVPRFLVCNLAIAGTISSGDTINYQLNAKKLYLILLFMLLLFITPSVLNPLRLLYGDLPR